MIAPLDRAAVVEEIDPLAAAGGVFVILPGIDDGPGRQHRDFEQLRILVVARDQDIDARRLGFVQRRDRQVAPEMVDRDKGTQDRDDETVGLRQQQRDSRHQGDRVHIVDRVGDAPAEIPRTDQQSHGQEDHPQRPDRRHEPQHDHRPHAGRDEDELGDDVEFGTRKDEEQPQIHPDHGAGAPFLVQFDGGDAGCHDRVSGACVGVAREGD